MAEAAIVSWTPANFVTVVLMVALMYFILGFIARAWQQSQGQAAGA